MIPATTERVPRFTDRRVNASIHEQTRENVARFASASPQLIDQRLRELDHEWDVERITGAWSAIAQLIGVFLAAAFGPWWLLLPGVLALSLLLHALFGWGPALPLIRRLGFRTECEIDYERYALKALRGDFQRLDVVTTPQDREDLSRFEGEGGAPAPEPVRDASDPEIVNEAIRAARA
jgi:hypothetical protein